MAGQHAQGVFLWGYFYVTACKSAHSPETRTYLLADALYAMARLLARSNEETSLLGLSGLTTSRVPRAGLPTTYALYTRPACSAYVC